MLLSRFLIIANLLGIGGSMSVNSSPPIAAHYIDQLKQHLSPNSTIRCSWENMRWSEYAAPQPGAVITVGTEDDVAEVVAIASKANIPFLVQSGGNGWADTFTLDSDGIIIDISELKAITFNSDKTKVTFQAGITNAEMIDAAWSNHARVSTSTCNCVSLLGATLGGGLSRTQGVYGLNIDQIISLTMVDAHGNKNTVTPDTDSDLWWALKGAGANFGIVTSAVFKSIPLPQASNTAWTGPVIFDQSKIEELISAIQEMKLEPEMEIDIYFATSPPDNSPTVIALPFYLGTEEIGRQKFAPVLDIGPSSDGTEVIPYNVWNAAGDSFCRSGGRKPSYTAGLKTMDPTTWRNVWNDYTSFIQQHPGASNSTVLAECYTTSKTAKSVDFDLTLSSYPFRDIKCYAIAIPWYVDPILDRAANQFGQKVRRYWTASAGTQSPSA